MSTHSGAMVKTGERLSEQEHLLSLVSQDQREQATHSLERGFAAPDPGHRRTFLLLGLILLSLVGTMYALNAHARQALPRQLGGVLFTGTCKPSAEIRVASQGLGTVASILVKPGDIVAEGQLLVRMDDPEAEDSVREAELQHGIAQQSLTRQLTRSSIARTNAALSQQQLQLLPARQYRDSPERARAAFDQAQRSYDRTAALLNIGSVSQKDVDDRMAELRIAKDDLDVSLKQAAASLRVTNAQVDEVRAEAELEREQMTQQLRRTELQEEESRRKLQRNDVRSPVRGVVAEVLAHEGDRLSGGVSLVRIAQLHAMLIEVPVAAELVSQLRPNQPVLIQLPTLPVREVRGTVRTISPLPATNMTHLVEVEFANADLHLFAGQPAKVRFLDR